MQVALWKRCPSPELFSIFVKFIRSGDAGGHMHLRRMPTASRNDVRLREQDWMHFSA